MYQNIIEYLNSGCAFECEINHIKFNEFPSRGARDGHDAPAFGEAEGLAVAPDFGGK